MWGIVAQKEEREGESKKENVIKCGKREGEGGKARKKT
jgi:hypothetical protein